MNRLLPDSASVADQSALGALGFVTRGLQGVLRHCGYQFQRFPAAYSYEQHLQALLSTLAVNCVIDVGAHHGEFYRLLRQTGYRGSVVSFEPLPESFQRLEHLAAGDRHWRGYNVALGREAGTLPINVPDSTGFASFLRPNAYCQERFPYAHWEGRTAVVRVERLESLYADVVAGIERPRVFLKMDTQGWDRCVLEGTGAALADVVALQSEVSVIPIYHRMPRLAESIAHYNALGFEVTNLFPVTFDAEGLCVIEYDCVMRRV